MQKRMIEILVGLFMIAGIVGLLLLAYRVSSFSEYESNNSYKLTAEFDNIGGLKVRAPINIAGVRVGQVSAISLDSSNFRAKVSMMIDAQDQNLPVDTSASILTQGLLGSNYISLSPGFSNESLKDGGTIDTTRSAMILEELIGQLMFKLGDGNKKEAGTGDASEASVPSAATARPNTAQPGTAAT